MWPQLASVLVWALVSASALYWGMQVLVTSPEAPAHARMVPPASGLNGGLARLLGPDAPAASLATAPAPAADARFALLGVLSPHAARAASEGLALIAVDGKPAKAYRVGARIDPQHVLQTVGPRSATLGVPGGAASVSLQITPPPAPMVPATAHPRAAEASPPAATAPAQDKDNRIDAAARQ